MKYLALVLAGVSLVVASKDDTGGSATRRARGIGDDTPADVMARNILEWIQGIYRQGVRKTRQQEGNGYLPPYSTQRPLEKPRPFQTASPAYQPSYTPQDGYPQSQPSSPNYSSTPRATYVPASQPGTNFVSSSSYDSSSTSYNPRPNDVNSPRPFTGSSGSSGSSAYPGTSTTYLPPQSSSYPASFFPSSNSAPSYSTSAGSPSPSFGYPSPTPSPSFPTGGSSPTGGNTNYGYPSPSPSPSFPTPGSSPTGQNEYSYPSPNPSFPTPGGGPGTSVGPSTGGGTGRPSTGGGTGKPSTGGGTGRPSTGGGTGKPSTGGGTGKPSTGGGTGKPSTGGGTGIPSTGSGTGRPSTGGGTSTSSKPTGSTGQGSSAQTPASKPTGPSGGETPSGTSNDGSVNSVAPDDDDLKHPPHIHNIEVQCSKTMMTIDIEFNRVFDGVIYSKGFFTDQNCRYVSENSGQTEYSFTVSLDSCGTEFINDFEGDAGQAYLENVLVLQNEPGIQEVWDTVRRVRCLWEGNINKALTVSLSVDMLNQEIVTFSGDTATAKLDIQVGKGPFAPAANGLVKIGETMTLVVSVEGDPGFDLQVRDCVARDETSTNVVQLTDERGCILKPKLFGAFQKTKETGNTGASIIAYAFFQAFKFPDVMDLFMECNIELCKTDCEACPDDDQQIEPGRRRRSISYAPTTNTTSSGSLSDPVRMGRGFRVILPDDLSLASSISLEKMEETALEELQEARNVCMSYGGFYISFSLVLATLVTTTLSSAVFYTKLQRIARSKNSDLPKSW